MSLTHLVVVPGHAVYLGGEPTEDSAWELLSFQAGEPPFYIEHTRRSVELLAADETALLVFSGGQTRSGSGPRSEALGYWSVADHYRWWDLPGVRHRATTEEHARDSLENVAYSVCRFFEHQGRFPERVTVVGWRFKAERFALHAEALGLAERFRYEGVNDPPDLELAVRGEARTVTQFREDPLGNRSALADKRVARNPERRTCPYPLIVAGLEEFLGGSKLEAPWA